MCDVPPRMGGEHEKQGDYSEMQRGRERARERQKRERERKKNICGIITFLLHASLLLFFAPYNITASKLCDSEETLHLGKALLEM